jgi:ectoine hydroxylase-related dioxygenase (phytanoyl-CoA dioxygenase family)
MTIKDSSDDFYGAAPPQVVVDEVERHAEELSLLGYSIMEAVLPADQLSDWRTRIDAAYKVQMEELGEETLARIKELDICRAPLLQDRTFIEMVMNEKVLTVMKRMLGDWFILNLQNAIINRPEQAHHQSAWHRDLPYQNWVISRPLAIGALFVIDEFSKLTGCTMILPSSHRQESSPSESWIGKHAVSVEAPPGSVIFFDAMVFHRAGKNTSKITRRAVNHLYTAPILKQQYDFPRGLGETFCGDSTTMRVLGFTSQVPCTAAQWRRERARKFDIKI